MNANLSEFMATLQAGGIAVARTDTLYGVLARADDEAAVAKVYAAKRRDPRKSCIILLADPEQAYGDTIKLSHDIEQRSAGAPTSFLLASPCAPEWLLRTADEMLAYRIPNLPWLRDVIRETGPLIAPSANPEGGPPALTIEEARRYFGEMVDYYLDGGNVPQDTPPSQLISINHDGTITRLR